MGDQGEDVGAPSTCPGSRAVEHGIFGCDRDPQMQTVIPRGLRHASRASTRSDCVLKSPRVGLRLKIQRTHCSRAYSSIPSSSGDRDRTAVGVSPLHVTRKNPGP